MQRSTGHLQAQAYLILAMRDENEAESYTVIVEMVDLNITQIISVVTESTPFTRANTFIRFPDSEEAVPLTDQVKIKKIDILKT